MKTIKCEGACCKGPGGREGIRVHVTAASGVDWGEFTYCAEAIKTDTDNGFTVESVEPPMWIMVFDGDGPPCGEFAYDRGLADMFEVAGFHVVEGCDVTGG